MKLWVWLCLLAGTLSLCACRGEEEALPSLQQATLVDADGIGHEARVGASRNAATAPRGIIILMDASESATDWEDLAQEAQTRGYAVVLLQAPEIHPSPADESLSNGAIDAGRSALQEAGAIPGGIAMLGSGTGACALITRAGTVPLALLSLPMPCAARATETSAPLLVMAGESDADSAAAAREIGEASSSFRDVKLFPGDARGVALCTGSARRLLFKWLDEVLAPR